MYATFTYTFRRYGTRQAAISTFAWLVESRRWQQGLVLRARWAYVIGLAGTSSQNVFTPETFLGVISFRCSSRCRGFDFHWIYEFPWCLNPWGEEWSQIGMSLGWRVRLTELKATSRDFDDYDGCKFVLIERSVVRLLWGVSRCWW